jgi:aminopeptidase 2
VLSIVVGLCTDSFTCEEQLNEVESFFEVKITEGFDRALMQSFDAIRAKGRWLERDMKDMEEWLHERHFL